MEESERKKRNVWDQRPDEPGKVFALFLAYRNMGVDRSIRKLHALVPGLTLDQLTKVANEFHFTFRADQYDAWLLGIKNSALERADEKRTFDEAKTAHDAALLAELQIGRLLWFQRKQKATIPKFDKEGHPVMDVKTGRQAKVTNPHFAFTPTVTMEIVTKAIELMRLLKGQAGTLDEAEQRKVRAELLGKLEKMAEALAPKQEQSIGEPPPPNP